MTNFDRRKKELAFKLFDVGAVRFKLRFYKAEPEKLSSLFYFDWRLKTHFKGKLFESQLIKQIGELLFDFSCKLNLRFNQIVGISEVGESIAEAFSLAPHFGHYCSLIKFWKEENKKKQKIMAISQGIWKPDEITLLIDDVINETTSTLEAIKVLQENDLKVYDILFVIDDEKGGKEVLEEKGYNVYTLFQASELFNLFCQSSKSV